MKLLINFANYDFYSAQKKNSQTGLSVGGFDKVIQYNPKDIDSAFCQKNQRLLSHKRGAGYWLWKPYFIRKTLAMLQDGDYLFYCDSGSHFISSINPLIKICEEFNQDLIVFELTHLERVWTKRDALILMNSDEDKFINTPQRLGGFSLWKKTPNTVNLTEEWLYYSQDERILSDIPNQLGIPNYSEFIEHRHDQSILSLLTKKHNIPAHRDPSQWGNPLRGKYPKSNYEQLIQLSRQRDIFFIKGINYIYEQLVKKTSQ